MSQLTANVDQQVTDSDFTKEELLNEELELLAVEGYLESEQGEDTEEAKKNRTPAEQSKIDKLARQLYIIRTGTPYQAEIAKTEIYEDYSRYVFSLVNQYFPTFVKKDQIREDLYQEGMVGLFIAVGIYNPEAENAAMPTVFFKSYILSKCSKYVTDYISHQTHHYVSRSKKIDIATAKLKDSGVLNPSALQIAEEANISVKSLNATLARKETSNIKLIGLPGQDGDEIGLPTTLKEFNPERCYEKQVEKEALLTALQSLTSEERTALLQRCELIEGKKTDFKSIAENLQVTIDRAKYVHEKAVKKMESNPILARVFSNIKEETRHQINKNSFNRISSRDIAMAQASSFYCEEDYEEEILL